MTVKRYASRMLLVCAGFLCGCASQHFTKGRGDVGQFIIQQAVVRGATPVTTNNLPAVSGRWRFSEDEYGIVIRMPRSQFPVVELLLRQTLGEPKLGPSESADGGKIGVYRFSPKGGALQFLCDTKQTQVIIIRPLNEQEFGESLMRAFQTREFQKALLKSYDQKR